MKTYSYEKGKELQKKLEEVDGMLGEIIMMIGADKTELKPEDFTIENIRKGIKEVPRLKEAHEAVSQALTEIQINTAPF